MRELTVGHYKTSAIEEYSAWRSGLPQGEKNGAIDISCNMLVGVLRHSCSWSISKTAFPVIYNTHISEADVEGIRLPFPLMAIEYVFDYEAAGTYPDDNKTPARKRILLLTETPDDGFRLSCIYKRELYIKGEPEWFPAPLSLKIKYGDLHNLVGWGRGAGCFLRTGDEGYPSMVSTVPMFDTYCADIARNDIPTLELFLSELSEEVGVVLSLLVVLSCKNAPIIDVPAPEKLNKKRQKRGKELIPAYRTLHISEGSSRAPTAVCSGSHASPRAHWRRGHIRHQPTAKGVVRKWIKATLVGDRADTAYPEVVLT